MLPYSLGACVASLVLTSEPIGGKWTIDPTHYGATVRQQAQNRQFKHPTTGTRLNTAVKKSIFENYLIIEEYAHDKILWEKNIKISMQYNSSFHYEYMQTHTCVQERMEENMLEVFTAGW